VNLIYTGKIKIKNYIGNAFIYNDMFDLENIAILELFRLWINFPSSYDKVLNV
jgi:hypothetical protein